MGGDHKSLRRTLKVRGHNSKEDESSEEDGRGSWDQKGSGRGHRKDISERTTKSGIWKDVKGRVWGRKVDVSLSVSPRRTLQTQPNS